MGNSDLSEWNAIGDPCACCSSKHSLVDMLLVPCQNGKISFHQSRKQQDRFQWPVEKLLALRLHDLKNVVMQKLLTGSIHCWGIAKVALEESIESDSDTDNDEDDHAENDHAENEVLPVRNCIDGKKQKKSSLLTLSQMFKDTSQSYMGCVGLVVALPDVLDKLSTSEQFDIASIVSRGVVIMGSDWVDSKHSTLRVRPCISSDEDLCVFFGDLVFPEAAAVAMLIKAQSVALSAPFLDLHAGHVSPSIVDSDSPFLGKVTLKDICYVANQCGHPLTQDQYAVAKYVVGFKSGFCGLSGPGGCGKTIILASCILSRMKYLRKK